jgi:hypothetical protein
MQLQCTSHQVIAIKICAKSHLSPSTYKTTGIGICRCDIEQTETVKLKSHSAGMRNNATIYFYNKRTSLSVCKCIFV